MKRRCMFLDQLPFFNYNKGAGEYITDENGKTVPSDTRHLGSTLMQAMLNEVEDFCVGNWSHKPHGQV